MSGFKKGPTIWEGRSTTIAEKIQGKTSRKYIFPFTGKKNVYLPEFT